MLYSLSERRFFGLCAWPSPQAVIVCDDTVEGLEQRMREAETLLILHMSPVEGRLGRAA
ncbi:hypothetical protein FHS44_004331 [Streptosporangium saharense]|uniref:Uncharacterized protein n=1 Tax=Streptosporangium saharense TaxID=1706840 RepID=A0A7W7QPE4_9ACTN|nr:hypothetical protein [Streptosporangium saharense]